jgi:site-specific recombinase XerD
MNLIDEFIKEQEAKGLSKKRIEKYRIELRIIQNKYYQKDFESLTTEKLREIVRQIENSNYSEWSKHDLKVILRKFVKWLNQKFNKNIDTSFISIKVKNNHKLPEEILTQEEIERMINVCDNIRDKAIISVLYESGCRIGEFLSLKLKNVQFDEYGAVLIIPNGKTGSRRVRIVNSAQLLKAWLNVHPLKHDSESYVWITNFNRKNKERWSVLSEQSINKILKDIAKRAGINKKVYPHLLRHSRATHLASFLTEAQMKEFFGWTQSSNMASIYVHLSGRDVDNALLKIYGLKKEELKPEQAILKIEDLNVNFNSQDKLKFELLVVDFLKAIAEEFPSIKQKFVSMVKERNLENLFK